VDVSILQPSTIFRPQPLGQKFTVEAQWLWARWSVQSIAKSPL